MMISIRLQAIAAIALELELLTPARLSTSANIPIARPASISSPIDFTALDELQQGGTAIMEWERKGIRGGYTRRVMAQSRKYSRIRSRPRINVSRQPDPKRSKRNHRRNAQPRIASTGTTTTASNSSGNITHNDNNNNANLKLFRSSKGRYLEYVNSACTASNGVVGLYSGSGNSPDDTCIFITDNRTMRRTRSAAAAEQQKDVLILLNFSQYLVVALEKELNVAKFLRRSTADTEEGVAIDADVLRCYPLLRHGLESAAVARYLLNESTTGAAILSLFGDAVAMLVHHVNTILLKFAQECRVGFKLILLLDIVLTPRREGVWE